MSAIAYIRELWKDTAIGFLDLIFPRICLGCELTVPLDDHIVCLRCLSELALTDQRLLEDNDFTEHFYGRVPIRTGSAMMYLDTDDKALRIVHNIKYADGRQTADHLGLWYGKRLAESPLYRDVDCIIPVPLHPKKLRQRGYNQSELWAYGMSRTWGVPVDTTWLTRKRYTRTQTKMTRHQRMMNIGGAFSVHLGGDRSYKHVLIVDDVLTTGSTLEACALAIRERYPHVHISMATIAMGRD